MIQCALRTKIKHISALSALGTDVLFLHLDICGVALTLKLDAEVSIVPFVATLPFTHALFEVMVIAPFSVDEANRV